MVLARLKTWAFQEILAAADLNAEIDNILNNANSLISPYTAAVDANLNATNNFVVERVGSLPGTVTNGRVVQLTTDEKFYIGDAGTGTYVAVGATVSISQKVLTNKEGSSLASGDLVTVHTAVDDAVEKADAITDYVYGVAGETISDNSTGIIYIGGGYLATVNVTGATTPGQFLVPSTTAGKADPVDTYNVRAFAVAMTTHSSSVGAILFGAPKAEVSGGHIYDCGISNNGAAPTTKTDVATGFIEVTGSSKRIIVEVTGTLVVDSGASGDLGLDTGSIATGWYYIKVIAKSSDLTVSALMSTASAAPTYPTGHDMYRNVGIVYVVSTGPTVIRAVTVVGKGTNRRYQLDDVVSALTNGTATSLTSVDLSAIIPPTATIVHGLGGHDDTSGWIELAANSSNAIIGIIGAGTIGTTIIDGEFSAGIGVFSIVIETADTIWYAVGAATDNGHIVITGYEEEL